MPCSLIKVFPTRLGKVALFVQLSYFQQQRNNKEYRETEKHAPLRGTQEITETIPDYTQALDLLHIDFKTTVLNMLKKLKKNTDKETKVNQGNNI